MDLGAWSSYPLLAPIRVTLHLEPSGWLPGASANRPSFQMLDWELKSRSLGTKSGAKWLQSDPKVIRMALGGHFKTYGFYGVGVTLGYFWRPRELISFLLIL